MPLPPPPSRLRYADIELRFCQIMPGDEARGLVPGYHFRIHNLDGIEVGHINFRVGDTEHVRRAVGHIGFGVHPEHRGHRYAGKAALALAPFVASRYPEVIITANPDNLASIRTIEAIGGHFIDEVDVPPHDPHYATGDHRKRRFRWSPGAAGAIT